MTASRLPESLRQAQPVCVPNPHWRPSQSVLPHLPLTRSDLDAAAQRLTRWGPALATRFPELAPSGGIIESPLTRLEAAAQIVGGAVAGPVFVKCDHALPVAGSIKARGGIHEVLVFAEKVGISAGLMAPDGDPSVLLSPAGRALLARYRVGVGSTGNLGLSIGTLAVALGFSTTVHMSSDARDWKKRRLRDLGVHVVEHPGDYAAAVAAGRAEMQADPQAHFVDDENSLDLFLGYAVAALRLQAQLAERKQPVDAAHPLHVYLPCGVGGAPGGITWGLKWLYGDAVRCYFAEPVASPAFMLRALADGPASVYDIGLDNRTQADGLAVAQASEAVFTLVQALVDGFFTVTDDALYPILARLHDSSGLRIEPSAAAGFPGLRCHFPTESGHGAKGAPEAVTHIVWSTGGALVPDDEFRQFLETGRRLSRQAPAA